MIPWPRKIGGTHKLGGWLNRLVAACIGWRLKGVIGPGYLQESTDGQTLVLLGNSSKSAGAFGQRFLFDSDHSEDDYITCVTWDGVTPGATPINIALTPKLRFAHRPSADHEIRYPFDTNDEIYAIKPAGGTGVAVDDVPVEWLMLADDRGWAAEIEICNGKKAWFRCDEIVDV